MSAIFEHLLKMIPFMLITVPFYIIIRIIFVKIKTLSVNWYRETALFLFVAFSVGLASQTVLPAAVFKGAGLNGVENKVHSVNLIPFKIIAETFAEVFEKNNITYFLINFCGNIIMFIPFGVFVPLIWRLSKGKTLIIGFCVSLTIEICQLFLLRGTDIDDLILNTFGVFVGYMVFEVIKNCKCFMAKFT